MFSEVAEITLVARLGQFQQLLKTRVILILNFTRPHAITYTNHSYRASESAVRLFCTTWSTWNNRKRLNLTQSSILMWRFRCSCRRSFFLNSLLPWQDDRAFVDALLMKLSLWQFMPNSKEPLEHLLILKGSVVICAESLPHSGLYL